MTEFNAEAREKYGLQDYSPKPEIDGLELIELRRFNDDGGAMTELGRLDGGQLRGVEGFQACQVNYSSMEPQVIKAFHLHRRQTDVWFVPPTDKILLVVADVRDRVAPATAATAPVVRSRGLRPGGEAVLAAAPRARAVKLAAVSPAGSLQVGVCGDEVE